jgi:hypothetical protein
MKLPQSPVFRRTFSGNVHLHAGEPRYRDIEVEGRLSQADIPNTKPDLPKNVSSRPRYLPEKDIFIQY